MIDDFIRMLEMAERKSADAERKRMRMSIVDIGGGDDD